MAAPTDNYDIEIFDQDGKDVLQTLGLNRDIAASEEVPLFYASTSVHPVVHEDDMLTLRVSNNLVLSAQVMIDLFFAPGV